MAISFPTVSACIKRIATKGLFAGFKSSSSSPMIKIILLLVGLHAIAAFAAFIPSTFSRSQGGHHNYLFHQSSRPQKQHEGSSSYWSRNSNMRMNTEGELPEVDIQAAIYDVANVVDQQTSELRRAVSS
jgi:hypothetical protein